MTHSEWKLLHVGSLFESPNGYQYKVLDFISHTDDPDLGSFIKTERLGDKTIRTYHYSKQPFAKLIRPGMISGEQKGNPYGNSRTIF